MRSATLFLIIFGFVLSGFAQSNANGFIGLGLADAPGSGAVVGIVKGGGPADQAGIKAGDIIVAINGTAMDNVATMTRVITTMAPGQTARLSVIRGWGESSPQRLTIAVVIGSPDRAPQSANTPAPPAPPRISTSATQPSAPPSSTAVSQSNATNPLTASGYTRMTDPLEQAFTVEVPTGWRSAAGLARRAALQINPYVRSLSPDKMTYLIVGDPLLPSFSPPSQMGNAIGNTEGKFYDAGLGGVALVMHYLPGAEFARAYGETMLQGLCPSLKFSSANDRPDLARIASQLAPTVIPSRVDGGEARFTCMHNKQEMEVRVKAATRITRDNVTWAVILLGGFITPKDHAEEAEQILTHVANSMTFNQAWIQMQNNLSQQAGEAINRRMQETLRQERTFIQNLNSVDESFESMDELITGYSTYRDDKTGSTYSLNNTNPYKWIDDSTGRIISTQTNTQPLWAPAFRALTHGTQ